MAEKKTKNVRKKQCINKGCRKARVEGSEYCQDCRPSTEGGDIPADVCRLSELDLLRFVRSDNELHNHVLEIKTVEQEQVIEDKEFEQRRAARQNRVRLLQQSIRQRQLEQKQLLADLGKKYGFDHTIASIDDQTGIIHEHSTKGS